MRPRYCTDVGAQNAWRVGDLLGEPVRQSSAAVGVGAMAAGARAKGGLVTGRPTERHQRRELRQPASDILANMGDTCLAIITWSADAVISIWRLAGHFRGNALATV